MYGKIWCFRIMKPGQLPAANCDNYRAQCVQYKNIRCIGQYGITNHCYNKIQLLWFLQGQINLDERSDPIRFNSSIHFWIVNILGLAWRGQLRQEERKCRPQLFDDSTLEKKPSFLHWMPSNAVFSTCLTALQSQSTFMSYM